MTNVKMNFFMVSVCPLELETAWEHFAIIRRLLYNLAIRETKG
jgi:hypothetical protein